jgi:hypothetical protein
VVRRKLHRPVIPSQLNGKMHGQRVYTYASGNKYEGDWEHGKMHGQGVCTYASSGKKYEGSGGMA